jgi:hyperosmotically inducible protein
MRTLVFPSLVTLLALSAGCDNAKPSANNNDTQPSVGAAADNTAVNKRDADGKTLTPFDQGESAADREMTAKIRREVVDLPDLSINAQNVKIITNGGKVTLRGPVASQAERDAIQKIAEEAAGAEHVDNQLEVPVK